MGCLRPTLNIIDASRWYDCDLGIMGCLRPTLNITDAFKE